MSPSDLKYTTHAFERMAERDISRATVEAVVVSGEMTIERGGIRRYSLEGLIVIVDGRDVVTAYFNRNHRRSSSWGPKQRQRRGQRQEYKPQYFKGRGYINVRQQEHYQRQMGG
jgi:uncharacterized GH25 family protein